MKEKLKEQISHKIDMVLRQYGISGRKDEVYGPILLDLKEKLFSGNKELEKEALKDMKSLLLHPRAWEPYNDYCWRKHEPFDIHKDKFIDDFNNFDEWLFGFLEPLVDDIERYVSHSNDEL